MIFIAIALTISGLIHWFLYARFVTALGITSPNILWTLRLAALFLAASYLIARGMDYYAPSWLSTGMHWAASIWLGLMLQLLWMTIDLWIIKFILQITGVWAGLSNYHAAIGRCSAIGVISLAVLIGGWSMLQAQRPIRVQQVQIPVKRITPELRQMKIVMTADFHAGLIVGERDIERWAEEINALEPDVILLPGDIIDHPPERVKHLTAAFRKLRAPLGVFATTGNHEYYIQLKRALEFIKDSEMRILMNERVELPGGLIIAGIEDRTARQMGKNLPTEEEILGETAHTNPAILLNHTPEKKAAERATEAGADLMVSGHTHGGQVWPFSLLTKWAFRFHHGLYEVGNGHQLTTCGIGTWGPPMRFGKPPEVMLIRLVGKNEPAGIEWE